jgi:pimeloyl-ACP methyl ester carboxylesterase
LRVIDELGWKSWVAGGHSIGGMIAIELARQRCRELGGVISLEGWTHHEVLRQAFSGKVDTTLSEELEQQRLQARGQTLCRLSQSQIAAFRSIWQRWDGLPILQSTSVPVLEVWGDRNQPRPSRRQMRIPERANIQLRWVPGASHSLPLERPQEVAGAIDRFVFSLEVS